MTALPPPPADDQAARTDLAEAERTARDLATFDAVRDWLPALLEEYDRRAQEIEQVAWERDAALARVAAAEAVQGRMADSLPADGAWQEWSERDRAVRDYEGELSDALAVEVDPLAGRRIEAERQRDVLSSLLRGMARRATELRVERIAELAVADAEIERLVAAVDSESAAKVSGFLTADVWKSRHDTLVAAGRALANEWTDEAAKLNGTPNTPSKSIAQHLLGKHAADLRAALGGTTDTPSPVVDDAWLAKAHAPQPMPAVEAAEFMAAVASARGPAGVETPAETGGTPEPDPQPVNVDLLALMREGVTSREPVGVPEAMHCDCGRALPCRHCPDVPTIWWSSEYQRFYMIGDGPMVQRLTSGPSLVHEPETRFMPSDIVPLVPAGSVSTTSSRDACCEIGAVAYPVPCPTHGGKGTAGANADWWGAKALLLKQLLHNGKFTPFTDGEDERKYRLVVAKLIDPNSDLRLPPGVWRESLLSGVSTTPDPAAVSVATDDFVDALYDQLPAVVTFPRGALEKAVRAALAGTATPEPAVENWRDTNPAHAAFCDGSCEKGAVCCPAMPSPLLGTWADPEFRAHQDHRHPVEGCGYCPSENEEGA